MTNIIGFMQGRLSELVDNKIQAFPWSDWETEFVLAESIGLNLMEWTLDQDRLYENPIMTKKGRARIKQLSKLHDIFIPSLTGDCFMQAPFWKSDPQSQKTLKKDFLSICRAAADLAIELVVVPLVDNGSLETRFQEDTLVVFMLENENFFKQLGIKIIFEIDYPPKEVARFINRLTTQQFGINYDIGNSAAMGFDPVYECKNYGNRILNVHIKDRVFKGTTVPLTTGDADFSRAFSALSNVGYSGDFILQTARAVDGEHVKVLKEYRLMAEDWVKTCTGQHLSGPSD